MKNMLINKNIILTPKAANQIRKLYKNNNNMNFRIFIIGGGCSGFKYEFILDKKINSNDVIIKSLNINLIIDQISIQYLDESIIDYIENIEESKFIIKNPNMKNICNCGSSFDI
ncbi:iron-sulfur cluster insertion protein ErpA [Enterobacteriaceae endosymbiont of Donacia tomentosa]|uniref:iron-sulfur cluster insertion protein ErpA n=1 Tax=Enterobacteriaceae endosymbiont of Donacia tomentosa TaxID=2675787 RepID=UPI00144A07E1|nr:iron-sulfur cluster insertion protein ErpA [Enterobacteriaceae endosymbiont of Donacia tomentosa]QJC31867.1 iron-sulfur cluster insertion protein ErpA [Enterobacteriaceae endosymbiont of Donacia tomentosa]